MIVDTDQLPSSAKASGDCDQIQEVSGEIIRIVKESNK
jgi:DNA-directed RNA polymerase subunit H (RpoH/RPB5)